MNNEEKAALQKKIKQELGLDKVTHKNYQTIEIANLVFYITDAMIEAYFNKQEGDAR